jgi:hypothetical protein
VLRISKNHKKKKKKKKKNTNNNNNLGHKYGNTYLNVYYRKRRFC